MSGRYSGAFSRGVFNSFSVGVGYLPIGFSFGAAAVQSGLPETAALLISMLVYAGASQFLLISLVTAGAGLLTAVPTVLLMNARHLLYGPTLVSAIPEKHAKLGSPWLAFGLTDEVFATAMSRLPSVAPEHRDYWVLGLQVGAYIAWAGGTALGVVFVREVDHWPEAVRDGLGFVLPSLFLALLLETGLRRWWASILASVVVAAILCSFVATHHALALGILVGALSHGLVSRMARE
ncbi:AzlC family ABC transporter permease [Stenotrophomonas sp. VV52]|uniref:AzlC family ABC transporter permease n=1 Tax=Stenotrophomonas sp. VV52 TaxID=2066958 RepID=UPI000C9E01D7|nr:AzlC family ABC transporter permease [Stenotrophomonas sp. VV52]